MKAVEDIPSQISKSFMCEHDTQTEGPMYCKRDKALRLRTHGHLFEGTQNKPKEKFTREFCWDTIDIF